MANVKRPYLPAADKAPKAPAADDLLSQLAEADIDKILAEAEDEIPEPFDAIAPTGRVGPISEELPPVKAATHEPIEPASLSQTDAALAASMDGLLEHISDSLSVPPTPDVEPMAASSAIHPEADTSIAMTEAHPDVPVEGSPEDRRATTGGIANRALAEAPAPIAKVLQEQGHEALPRPAGEFKSPQGDDDFHEPLIIRLLDILNSPMDSIPDPLRDILGKIGLLTLFNSVILLLYVHYMKRK